MYRIGKDVSSFVMVLHTYITITYIVTTIYYKGCPRLHIVFTMKSLLYYPCSFLRVHDLLVCVSFENGQPFIFMTYLYDSNEKVIFIKEDNIFTKENMPRHFKSYGDSLCIINLLFYFKD